jgi:hypothetical protein
MLAFGSTEIRSIAREASFLYTIDSSAVLRAVDVSMGVMVPRGSLVLPAAGGKLFVGDGIAYVGAGNGATGGFVTANVSNPDSLTLISGPDILSVGGTAIAANGSGLLITAGTVFGSGNIIDVMDVSDPANTGAFLTRFTLPAPPQSIAIGAGIAFIADGTGGLVVVNYLPFDNKGQSPTVTIATDALDLDPTTPGVQVIEGSTIAVRPSVFDDVQVRNVELLVNGQVVLNDVSFPFDLSTDLPSIAANGSTAVTIQVRASRHFAIGRRLGRYRHACRANPILRADGGRIDSRAECRALQCKRPNDGNCTHQCATAPWRHDGSVHLLVACPGRL